MTAIRSNAEAEGEWGALGLGDSENYPDKCNVVEIFGAPGSTTADRSKGFMATHQGTYDNIVLLESQVGNNMRSGGSGFCMENLIQAYGDEIDVVVTHPTR